MKILHLLLSFIILLAIFLRFNNLSNVPYGLYIDEVSSGYNGYTILHTGRDEHGVWFPFFFQAFGEYKMPLLIYSMSSAMFLFGKTEFAVRFPSALLGSATVLLFYFFVKLVLSLDKDSFSKKIKEYVPLVGAFILAITPWHIQFSRGGFDATLALFFFLLGLIFLLKFYLISESKFKTIRHPGNSAKPEHPGSLSLKNIFIKRFWTSKNDVFIISYLLIGSISLIITIYGYNTYRPITPLVFIISFLLFFKFFPKRKKEILSAIVLSLVLFIPIILFTFSSNGTARFDATSAFSEYQLPLIQKIFVYPIIYLRNYFTAFSFSALFVTGDGIGRHTITGIGPMFRWELPFLLIGLYYLIRNYKTKFAKVVFVMLFILPLSAALTRPSPNLLRLLQLVIPLTLLVSLGIVKTFLVIPMKMGIYINNFMDSRLRGNDSLKSRSDNRALQIAFSVLVLIFMSFEFAQYLHLYYVHYPMITILDWGGENKQVVIEATRLSKNYAAIVIDYNLGQYPEYFKFYNDKLKYITIDNSWIRPKELQNKKVLYITPADVSKNKYLDSISHKHIEDIRMPNLNHDLFAQFWEI